MAYRFAEYLMLLDAVAEAGIPTRTVREWGPPGLYILHDVHSQIEPCRAFAREEARRGVRTSFFFLPESRYNREWFGTSQMFDVLADLRDAGAELGFHIDPFELDILYGRFDFLYRPVYRRVREWKAYFHRRGFPMAVANLHGSTKHRRSGMVASDFFRETQRDRNVIRGCDPSRFHPHFGRYRLRRLPFDRTVVLSMVYEQRARRLTHPDYYLSDNSKRIVLHKIDPERELSLLLTDFHANVEHLRRTGRYEELRRHVELEGDLWSLDADLIAELVRRIDGRRVLALIHPQWFHGAEDEV